MFVKAAARASSCSSQSLRSAGASHRRKAHSRAPTAGSSFSAARPYDGGSSSLFLVNANGTGLVQLTRGYQHDAQPSWSPDGSLIAFESTRSGDTDVYVIRPDGSSLEGADLLSRLRRRSGLERRRPHVSRSRRRATASSTSTRSTRDGTGEVRLTTLAADDADPAWSPDGTRIAFMSDRTGRRQVWVDERRRHRPDAAHERGEHRRREPELVAERPYDRLRLRPRRRRQPRHLVDEARTARRSGDSRTARHSTRSRLTRPTGSSIVFVSDRTAKDNREFFQMTATGGSQHRLLASRLWDMSPDWGPSLGRAGCTITGTINSDLLVGTRWPRRHLRPRRPRRDLRGSAATTGSSARTGTTASRRCRCGSGRRWHGQRPARRIGRSRHDSRRPGRRLPRRARRRAGRARRWRGLTEVSAIASSTGS